MDPLQRILNHPAMASHLDGVTALFGDMDAAYQDHAQAYGFSCDGCRDNCCQTRFHHHTVMEFIYLRQGLQTLPPDRQRQISASCRRIFDIYRAQADTGDQVRVWCPLNAQGRCLLYHYRPMICRLHGIPHELHSPAGGVQYHPGCETFSQLAGLKVSYRTFDRTPFYRRMAALEQGLRRELDFTQRLKMTVAQMLTADDLFNTLCSRLAAKQFGNKP